MPEFIRLRPATQARGYVVSLHTGDAFRDATGVGHAMDGRVALPAAWRDLARNTGRTVADLKALPRKGDYLRRRV